MSKEMDKTGTKKLMKRQRKNNLISSFFKRNTFSEFTPVYNPYFAKPMWFHIKEREPTPVPSALPASPPHTITMPQIAALLTDHAADFKITATSVLQKGIVRFQLPLAGLRLTPEQSHALHQRRCHFYIDILGEEIIRRNLDYFSDIARYAPDYDTLCKRYLHNRFVLTISDPHAVFYFHISLLYRILNEELRAELLPPDDLFRTPTADEIESVVSLKRADNGDMYFKQPIPPSDKHITTQAISLNYVFLVNHFTHLKQTFECEADSYSLTLQHSGKHGGYACHIGFLPLGATPVLGVYVIGQEYTPMGKLPAMQELIGRINFELAIGQIVLDFTDGEVFFKATVNLNGCPLTSKMIDELVHTSLKTFDHFIPAIRTIINTNTPPSVVVGMFSDDAPDDDEGFPALRGSID